MMTTALQTGRTRAQNDLLTAERSLRNQVELNVRDLRQLLLELAVRFDGQRLEALRRDDPSAPAHWSPDDWRSFFSAIQFAVAGWETQKDLHGKRELKQQVEGMRAQIQTLTGQLENAQLALAEKETALARAVANATKRHTSNKGEATNTKKTLPKTLLTDLPEGVTPPTVDPCCGRQEYRGHVTQGTPDGIQQSHLRRRPAWRRSYACLPALLDGTAPARSLAFERQDGGRRCNGAGFRSIVRFRIAAAHIRGPGGNQSTDDRNDLPVSPAYCLETLPPQ